MGIFRHCQSIDQCSHSVLEASLVTLHQIKVPRPVLHVLLNMYFLEKTSYGTVHHSILQQQESPGSKRISLGDGAECGS